MLLNKGKYRGKTVIVLLSFALLSGCGAKPGDTVSLPPLEMDSISAVTYRRCNEGDKEDGENDECTLSFDYKGTLAFGKPILIGEEWHMVFIMDAKTAELYFSSPEYEDQFFYDERTCPYNSMDGKVTLAENGLNEE